MLKNTHTAEIDTLLAKYADRRSAVLPLLYIAQDTYGYLSRDVIREVATILDMPFTDVFEVVGFYTLFYDRPVGKWILQVCDDVPCCYLGAEELVAALCQKLGIREEQTTEDGMFTLQRVKCLAACDRAPVLQANLDYIYDVVPEHIDTILRDLRARVAQGETLSVSGHLSEDYEFGPDGALKLIPRNLGLVDGHGLPAHPEQSEAHKVAAEEEMSAPEEPAKVAVKRQMDTDSPVESSPDHTSAGAHPAPEQQAEESAIPAHAAQQEPPDEKKETDD